MVIKRSLSEEKIDIFSNKHVYMLTMNSVFNE